MEKLEILQTSAKCSFYRIAAETELSVERYIASTPETRAICNDPLIAGVEYTEKLRSAGAAALQALVKFSGIELFERQTVVLNILRGGLNFGLREALADAYGWNDHVSAFVSAQRSRAEADREEWTIGENYYKKLYVPQNSAVVCGDVVATGTTLLYALKEFFRTAEERSSPVLQVVFFTIGGAPAEDVLAECDEHCRRAFSNYIRTAVVYFEGRFDVARPDSRPTIKLTGTDLLRGGALLAPEFLSSQYDNPCSALERCAIYDAGSRAFYTRSHYQDVLDYWRAVHMLALNGTSYSSYLSERFPELEQAKFAGFELTKISSERIAHLDRILSEGTKSSRGRRTQLPEA